MEARFWYYYEPADSDVRVALSASRPSMEFSFGGPNEEGYAYTSVRLTLDGDTVRQETATEAHDCDGRLDTSYESECRVDRLDARCVDSGRYPAWHAVDSRQRDHSAEAAGY